MLSAKGGYSWVINTKTQKIVENKDISTRRMFSLICTSWSHSPVESLLRRNQEYLSKFYVYHTKLTVYFL